MLLVSRFSTPARAQLRNARSCRHELQGVCSACAGVCLPAHPPEHSARARLRVHVQTVLQVLFLSSAIPKPVS